MRIFSLLSITLCLLTRHVVWSATEGIKDYKDSMALRELAACFRNTILFWEEKLQILLVQGGRMESCFILTDSGAECVRCEKQGKCSLHRAFKPEAEAYNQWSFLTGTVKEKECKEVRSFLLHQRRSLVFFGKSGENLFSDLQGLISWNCLLSHYEVFLAPRRQTNVSIFPPAPKELQSKQIFPHSPCCFLLLGML